MSAPLSWEFSRSRYLPLVNIGTHFGCLSIFRKLFLCYFTNLWIFVFVLDLIGAFADKMFSFARPAGIRQHPGRVKGQETYRFNTSVEMLMKPHGRRHEHAPFVPIDALAGFARSEEHTSEL